MKIRHPKTKVLEQVKIRKSSDKHRPDLWVIDLEGDEVDSRDMLLRGYEIVELERNEMLDFDRFLEETRIQLDWTEEYFLGKRDAYVEILEQTKNTKDEDEAEDEELGN